MHFKNLTFLSLLSLSSALFAQDGIYVEGGLGSGFNTSLNLQNTEYTYDRGLLGSVSLGYQYDLFRFEVEGKYRQNDINSASYNDSSSIKVEGLVKQISPMINAYYSSGYTEKNLASTIGFGVGTTSLTLSDIKELGISQNDISETLFSMQAMFSADYKIDDNLEFIAKYTYFYTFKSGTISNNSDNIFSFNLRYSFK
ncbi:hypothetical protein JHD50_07655 [Sulfurimonas sp. MAG313]|nr:outer membrane beta-barrel protein [Sulfurimonas sp. MAG313]MDF1881177.1 hypothetical protein [Sulfurimonas sp. MAG313]